MRHHGCAGREIGLGGLRGRVRMSYADKDTRLGKRLHLQQRGIFRRQRRQQYAHIRAIPQQTFDIAGLHGADQGGVMCALAGQRQVWSFEMQSKIAGDLCRLGGAPCLERQFRRSRRVGNQRRQKLRRAEAGMGRCNGADGLERGYIAELSTAAAINLQVDEAGHDPLAVIIDVSCIGRNGVRRNNSGETVAVYKKRLAVVPLIAIENAGAPDRGLRSHCVSVTFLSATGWSGL